MEDPKMFPEAPLTEDAGDASPASPELTSSNVAFGGYEREDLYQKGTYPSNAGLKASGSQAYGTAGNASGYGSNVSGGQAYGTAGNASGYGSKASGGQAYGTAGNAAGYGGKASGGQTYGTAGNTSGYGSNASGNAPRGSYGSAGSGYNNTTADNMRGNAEGFANRAQESYNSAGNSQGSYGTAGNGQGGYGAANGQGGYGTANGQNAYGAPGSGQGGYGYSNNGQGGYGGSTNSYGGESYGAPQGNGYGPSNQREEPQNNGTAVSVVSLVFGILSVVCCWTFVLPFIFGTVAIICGIVGAVKHQKKALWLIGLITGVLGMLITVIMLASMLPLIQALIDEMDRHGGNLTPQDIQRILREYGIEVNIGAKFLISLH